MQFALQRFRSEADMKDCKLAGAFSSAREERLWILGMLHVVFAPVIAPERLFCAPKLISFSAP
jgi:hypothetical protein